MFLYRKLYTFGNKWHTFCCFLSGILLQYKIVEGKDDRPMDKLAKELSYIGGVTTGLLLWLRNSVFQMDKLSSLVVDFASWEL